MLGLCVQSYPTEAGERRRGRNGHVHCAGADLGRNRCRSPARLGTQVEADGSGRGIFVLGALEDLNFVGESKGRAAEEGGGGHVRCRSSVLSCC